MKKIVQTKNYSLFKHLIGNRSVRSARVKAIIRSIQKVGYITSPIIVNEKFEIIDGQARTEALQTLSLPVEYIIHKGIGLEECRAMNVDQSNWTLNDFIDSYTESGDDNYRRLKIIIQKYPNIGISSIVYAATGDRLCDRDIRNGSFKLNAGAMDTAYALLDELSSYDEKYKKTKGKKVALYNAILFCLKANEIDNTRLKTKLFQNMIERVTDEDDAIQQINTIYNDRIRGDKVYITVLFDKYKTARKKGKECLPSGIRRIHGGIKDSYKDLFELRRVINGKQKSIYGNTPDECFEKYKSLMEGA